MKREPRRERAMKRDASSIKIEKWLGVGKLSATDGTNFLVLLKINRQVGTTPYGSSHSSDTQNFKTSHKTSNQSLATNFLAMTLNRCLLLTCLVAITRGVSITKECACNSKGDTSCSGQNNTNSSGCNGVYTIDFANGAQAETLVCDGTLVCDAACPSGQTGTMATCNGYQCAQVCMAAPSAPSPTAPTAPSSGASSISVSLLVQASIAATMVTFFVVLV